MTWKIRQGDCIEQMRELDGASVDAVVCDPPYGIGFMGHEWDQPGEYGSVRANGEPGLDERAGRRRQPSPAVGAGHARERKALSGGPTGKDNRTHTLRGGAMHAGRYDLSLSANQRYQQWCEAWARETLRVLKPGGHLLVSGGTRTYHRLAAGIEDAGFEIRDSLVWLYGSGFPKSLDVSKAIDKAAGAEREVVGKSARHIARGEAAASSVYAQDDWTQENGRMGEFVTAPATPEARQWQGWGTALKPGHEPIVFARKPLSGTVAATVAEHGTGALNVDGCRVGNTEQDREASERAMSGDRMWRRSGITGAATFDAGCAAEPSMSPLGRWPANVALSPEAAEELDRQSGELHSQDPATRQSRSKAQGVTEFGTGESVEYADRGGASRFFYTAKASRAERNAGLDAFDKKPLLWSSGEQSPGTFQAEGTERAARNSHPTVKPIDLMRWLCRLVTPPGGTILDPFTGSGTTGIAAHLEGFDFIGIEREAEYVAIAQARIEWWSQFSPGTETDAALGLDAVDRKHRDAGQGSLLDQLEAA